MKRDTSRSDEAQLSRMGEYLAQAILLEVCAAPKPGLVTRLGNGSHEDMSILTFAMSSPVLIKAFDDLEVLGQNFDDEPEALFAVAREYGVRTERRLLEVTQGVNTQRGILFCGGVLSAAAGYAAARGYAREALLPLVQRMTAGLVRRELENAGERRETAGERLFQRYRITGIRGEVERGFPSVREKGLPALEEAFSRGANLNDALLHSLLSLMTVVEDSTVLWRTDRTAAREVKEQAKAILSAGSVFSKEGRGAISATEAYFMRCRISPGGSADLLSVTIALYLLRYGTFPVSIV